MNSCQDIEIYNSLVRKINEIIGELSTLNNHKLEVQRIVNKCIELKQQIENESYQTLTKLQNEKQQTLDKINTFNNNILNYTELLEILNTEANNLRQTAELEGNHLFVENSKEGLLEINKIQGNTLWVDNDTEEVLAEFDSSKILRIQSCFEDKVVTQEMVDNGEDLAENLGKYKAEINVVGKNKWSDITYPPNVWKVAGWGNEEVSYNNGVYTFDIPDGWQSFAVNFPFDLNKQYTIKFKGKVNSLSSGFRTNIRLIAFSSNNYYDGINISPNYESVTDWNEYSYTFTPKRKEIGFCFGLYQEGQNGLTNWSIKDVQIEEGSTATAYEPYKEYNKTLYLNNPPLKEDTIEQQGDKIVHVHRYNQETISEIHHEDGWIINSSSDNTVYISRFTDNASWSNVPVLSNTLPYVGELDVNDIEGVRTNGSIDIRLNKNKFSTLDYNGISSYLSTNPLTVVYGIRTPTTEIICENIFKVNKSFNKMSIDFDSVIPVEKASITYTGDEAVMLLPLEDDISLNSTDEITRNDEEVL